MKRSSMILAVVCSVSIAQAAVPKKALWSPSVESVTEMLKMPPENRHRTLAEQPDTVYDSLLKIANASDKPMNLRWRAITSAALLRKDKSAPDLMKAAESSEWFMRNAALVGLAEFAPEQAIPVARKLIKDPALVVRSAAVDVLSKNGKAGERELLWNELHAAYNKRGGQSLWIRSQIVKALADTAQPTETPLFSSLLTEKEEPMQKAAIAGLEKITGLKLGEGVSSHPKVVQLWKNYFSSTEPSSKLRQ